MIKLKLRSTFRPKFAFFSLIKHFNLRGEQPCEFPKTNESVYYITPTGLVGDTNLAFMTSCGNTLLNDLKIVSHSRTLKESFSYFKRLFFMYSCCLFFFVFCFVFFFLQSLTQVTTRFIFLTSVLATCHSLIFHHVVVVLPSASG